MADAGAWPYRFALIPLEDLFVDEAYQRPLSRMYRRVRDDYDPLLIGTLIASDRSRTRKSPAFALVDGQSRKQGMQDGEHTDVAPCVVYEGLTRQQEADLFARLQTERRGMATWLRFRAALVAKNPEAHAIAALAQAEGFKVAGDGGDEKGIKSIAALEWLYRRDPELLQSVLTIVRETWGVVDAETPTAARERARGEILQGIGRFLRETDNVNHERLVRNLSAITPEQLRFRANQLREGSGSSGNYSMFIRDALVGVYARRPIAEEDAADGRRRRRA